MSFMESLERQQMQETENGALGYTTTGQSLLDLNFAVPAFRRKVDIDHIQKFTRAFRETPNLTLRWLLFLRDIREGLGERNSFREFLRVFLQLDSKNALDFLYKVDISEYGRWDDYVYLYTWLPVGEVRDAVVGILKYQLNKDLHDYDEGKPISLLAKWLPSEGASSESVKASARALAKDFHFSSKQYRQILSKLRKYLKVVEVDMSANKWADIEYEKVPSGANLKYANAFFKHDKDRRVEYLESLKKGEVKINANTLFLYEIVHKYGIHHFSWLEEKVSKDIDETLEALWKAQEPPKEFANTLVVRDGSRSMTSPVGNSAVTAKDVADSLTLYLSEYNSDEYKHKFVTFSKEAKLLDVSNFTTLRDKLVYLNTVYDMENTNVENVLSLVLRAMKESNKSVDRLLFISD